MSDEKFGDTDYRQDRRYILESIRRIEDKQEKHGETIATLATNARVDKLDTRLLKTEKGLENVFVRSGIWGLISGLIPVSILLAMRALAVKP